jgi:hypothetical protein
MFIYLLQTYNYKYGCILHLACMWVSDHPTWSCCWSYRLPSEVVPTYQSMHAVAVLVFYGSEYMHASLPLGVRILRWKVVLYSVLCTGSYRAVPACVRSAKVKTRACKADKTPAAAILAVASSATWRRRLSLLAACVPPSVKPCQHACGNFVLWVKATEARFSSQKH